MKKIFALVTALVIMTGIGFGSYLLLNRNDDEQTTLSDHDVVVAYLLSDDDYADIESEDDIGRLELDDEIDDFGLLGYMCYDRNDECIAMGAINIDYYRYKYTNNINC